MKCVFISSPSAFAVHTRSLAEVELCARSWVIAGARGTDRFSVYPEWPVKYRKGETAVFFPTSLGSKRQRQRMLEAFKRENPGVAGWAEHDPDPSVYA